MESSPRRLGKSVFDLSELSSRQLQPAMFDARDHPIDADAPPVTLLEAATRGDVKGIGSMLAEGGAAVDHASTTGTTALMASAHAGQAPSVDETLRP